MDNAAYAASSAEKAQLTAYDAIVLIGWLSERLFTLESLLAELPQTPPKLTSTMRGFGCIPDREKAVRTALSKIGLP